MKIVTYEEGIVMCLGKKPEDTQEKQEVERKRLLSLQNIARQEFIECIERCFDVKVSG